MTTQLIVGGAMICVVVAFIGVWGYLFYQRVFKGKRSDEL